MEKSLTKKVLKNAATTEGVATIGGAGVGGWLGSSVGLAGFWGGIAGTIPIAALGAGICYLGVKVIKYKNKLNKIKKEQREKKRFGWNQFLLLKKYYNFGFIEHIVIILAFGLMSIGWGTVCEVFGLSNTLYESVLSIPLGIVILASMFCLLMKIVRKIVTWRMEIILIILGIIVGIYLFLKIEDRILIFTAGLVGSKKRSVGVIITWIIIIIIVLLVAF